MKSPFITAVVILSCLAITSTVSADPRLIVDLPTGEMRIDVVGTPWIVNSWQVISTGGNLIADPDTNNFHIPEMNLLLGNDATVYSEGLFSTPARDATVPVGSYPLEAKFGGPGQDLEFSSESILVGNEDWTTIYAPEPSSMLILVLGTLGFSLFVRRRDVRIVVIDLGASFLQLFDQNDRRRLSNIVNILFVS